MSEAKSLNCNGHKSVQNPSRCVDSQGQKGVLILVCLAEQFQSRDDKTAKEIDRSCSIGYEGDQTPLQSAQKYVD